MGDVAVAPTSEPIDKPIVIGDPTVAESSDAPAERHARVGRWWNDRWLWLAAIVVTAARWLEAADRRVFHVAPDEPAQLAMARWFAGGTRWNMLDRLTYRPGYALVLAPFARVAGSGEQLVRASLTLNAVFAGVSAVVLARLLIRWTDLSPRACAGVAAATALAPAAISSSAYTWGESLITLTFLGTLLAIQVLIEDRRDRTAVIAVVIAAFAMTVHGRSLPLLPLTAVWAAILLLRDRRWASAGAVLGLAAALGLASLRFTAWVHGNVWDQPDGGNTAQSVVSRLDAPVALIDSFVGQGWYQLVSTLGLVGVGTTLVLVALVRPTARFGRWQASTVVVLMAPLVLTSVAFMAGRSRPDQLVYGRYVDAVNWPLTALGLAWVVRRLRPTQPHGRSFIPPLVAVITVVFGIVVALRHGDRLAADVGLRMMVPGLLPYIGSHDGVPVVRITVVAVVAVLALSALAGLRIRRHVPNVLLVGAAAVVLAWSGVRVHDAQSAHLNAWAIGDSVAEIDRIVPANAPIGVVVVETSESPDETVQHQRIQVYQLFLPNHEFVRQQPLATSAVRYVIAPQRVPALSSLGAKIVWRDPAKPMALWDLEASVERELEPRAQ